MFSRKKHINTLLGWLYNIHVNNQTQNAEWTVNG